MSIITIQFFILLLITYILILIVNNKIKDKNKCIKITNTILLLSSFIFTSYADIRFTLILISLCIVTWYCAKKNLTTIGIIFAITILSIFKYLNFFISSFSELLNVKFTSLNIILPLGLSFYTFSAIGYLVDVKRQKINFHSLLDVCLYLSYFPKITSGPIQSSNSFFTQIKEKRELSFDNFSTGIQIYVFGLFKKIVLADRLSVFVNQVYETPKAFSGLTLLFAVISYSLQIYFDFSGYSDMAIGISRIFDIKIENNFNLPYLSKNVTEFWKRWHISLSSWLQQYLYIPLGGNRKGLLRTYLNLIITMVIGGLWHGANWTYIIWGLLNGLALVIHKLFKKYTKGKIKDNEITNIIYILLTFIFISITWIFFRADSLKKAMLIIHRILNLDQGVNQPYLWSIFAIIIYLISIIFARNKSKNKKNITIKINGYYPILDLRKFSHLVLFFVFCGLIICLCYTGGSPFIYGNY